MRDRPDVPGSLLREAGPAECVGHRAVHRLVPAATLTSATATSTTARAATARAATGPAAPLTATRTGTGTIRTALTTLPGPLTALAGPLTALTRPARTSGGGLRLTTRATLRLTPTTATPALTAASPLTATRPLTGRPVGTSPRGGLVVEPEREPDALTGNVDVEDLDLDDVPGLH
ncbi:MAG: hypothetical protein JWO79_3264, partial [Actinomycetia bacterium]|nr:hypothetical protein [Actinomycetes bacterium]